MGTVILADCGLKVIDLSGSNTISIDAGTLVMNGDYVENGNSGGFAIRVSSKVAEGEAAIIDLNKGSLVAANSPIGVKADAGKTATSTIDDSDYWLLSGVKGSTSYYGRIKINLKAGDNMAEGERTLATGTTLTLTPDKTGNVGFYKILINMVPKAPLEGPTSAE